MFFTVTRPDREVSPSPRGRRPLDARGVSRGLLAVPGHQDYSLSMAVRSMSMSYGAESFSRSWWTPVETYVLLTGSS